MARRLRPRSGVPRGVSVLRGDPREDDAGRRSFGLAHGRVAPRRSLLPARERRLVHRGAAVPARRAPPRGAPRRPRSPHASEVRGVRGARADGPRDRDVRERVHRGGAAARGHVARVLRRSGCARARARASATTSCVRHLQGTGSRPKPGPGEPGSGTVDDHRHLARGETCGRRRGADGAAHQSRGRRGARRASCEAAAAAGAAATGRAAEEAREEGARPAAGADGRLRRRRGRRSAERLAPLSHRGAHGRQPHRGALGHDSRARRGDGLARGARDVRGEGARSGAHVVEAEPSLPDAHLRGAGPELGAATQRGAALARGDRHVAQHDEAGARGDRAAARRAVRARRT